MSEKNCSYDPDWEQKYGDMIATPDEAVAEIRPGQRVFIGSGCAQPTDIFLSDIPRLFTSGQLPLDVALIQLTPPDERGIC